MKQAAILPTLEFWRRASPRVAPCKLASMCGDRRFYASVPKSALFAVIILTKLPRIPWRGSWDRLQSILLHPHSKAVLIRRNTKIIRLNADLSPTGRDHGCSCSTSKDWGLRSVFSYRARCSPLASRSLKRAANGEEIALSRDRRDQMPASAIWKPDSPLAFREGFFAGGVYRVRCLQSGNVVVRVAVCSYGRRGLGPVPTHNLQYCIHYRTGADAPLGRPTVPSLIRTGVIFRNGAEIPRLSPRGMATAGGLRRGQLSVRGPPSRLYMNIHSYPKFKCRNGLDQDTLKRAILPMTGAGLSPQDNRVRDWYFSSVPRSYGGLRGAGAHRLNPGGRYRVINFREFVARTYGRGDRLADLSSIYRYFGKPKPVVNTAKIDIVAGGEVMALPDPSEII